MQTPTDSHETEFIRSSLLAWYDRHARVMPWRVGPAARRSGVIPDPYHVWLSEVMLQQTQVVTVAAYFNEFLSRWPSVHDLAEAPGDDVMAAWAGLGYYSRARNLKKCADTIANDHDGKFPRHSSELLKLPGIGQYTAAAIAAIAFDEPIGVVDGNIERVISRLHALAEPVAKVKTFIREVADLLAAGPRPGDLAQAIMDLGATVCTPRKPACMLCPIQQFCAGHGSGTPEAYPGRKEKRKKPLRYGAAFVACNGDGAVFLRRRPERGMLAGMSEVPTTNWSAAENGDVGANAAMFDAQWKLVGTIRHSFTHFDLELEVWLAKVETGEFIPRDWPKGWWSPPERIANEALPTVMRKVITAAIPGSIGPDSVVKKSLAVKRRR